MAEHFCGIHNTAFFKKGKMRGYAHPIGDTGEWCNEEEQELANQEASIAEAANQPTTTPKPEQMTKDDWADKDKVTRRSIERQSAAKLALEFAPGENLSGTLANAETIYQWISGQGDSPKPSPQPVKSTQSTGKDESKGIGGVKNLSDFHKVIFDDFGIQPDLSLKILDKEKWGDLSESFEDCYSVIKAYHEAKK